MDNTQFVKLCSKAWTIPVLSALAQQKGGRIAPIATKLDASRSSITTTFQHLAEIGLITRNAGHGHPLRPEFVLTSKGQRVAEWANSLDINIPVSDQPLLRKQWTLPVLRLIDKPRRYRDLRELLRPVTDRALSISLKEMSERNWLERLVENDHNPPRVAYRPAGFATRLQPILSSSFQLS